MLSSVNALNVEHPPTVELRRGFDVIESREVSNAQAYAAQVDAFAAAIEEGREFDIPGEEGLAQPVGPRCRIPQREERKSGSV